ncbi:MULTISPECIES: S8 family peptidase [Paenibacillus]|uniref:S8 family peptidase n=1 Tax=Paenibacillus agilis TaxID=3020863 RepID=A0A559IVH2_9BACL|nr:MULTISPECIES: S8 family peptidase [Paenibacillus]TVX91609.1 S8 family peptidase [Paenibacillus agilis]
MARENNFLLGNGEHLTNTVNVPRRGGKKIPPYSFPTAQKHFSQWLGDANEKFNKMSSSACPNDEVTALVTMHPRYISKSDFPIELLDTVGLRAVGGRSKRIKPMQWGIEKHPEEAVTDQIFVMGKRSDFTTWYREINNWTEAVTGAKHLSHIEDLSAHIGVDKVQALPENRDEYCLEVVFHETSASTLDMFEYYAKECDAYPIFDRKRESKGLIFLPVYASKENVHKLADFSYIRVVRSMPTLRPLQPEVLRKVQSFPIKMNIEPSVDQALRVAIFDGGIPSSINLSPWVNLIEPPGIGAAVPEYQEHGLAVTSAFLFGPLEPNKGAERPLCHVDHIRVLDDKTGSNGDFECYDVLDRILHVLDNNSEPYHFLNFSVGPDIPIEDDEVTGWTASLDERLCGGSSLTTVAAGNSGNLCSVSGLNRIQPPSDAVNVMAIGACDSVSSLFWKRVDYSSVGPGRSPGLVKPDGLVFGGSQHSPFYVLESTDPYTIKGTMGTSFAAPYGLRSAAAVRVQLGNRFSPLAIRALLTHRAESEDHSLTEVGWGRLETDYNKLITCDDDEALIVFQGELPVGSHLRAPVPLPSGDLEGMIGITATLVIAPEVDPSYPNTYTRGGLEVTFRPDSTKRKISKEGKVPLHANSKSFFNVKNLFGSGAYEYELRDEGHKWEPCLKVTQQFKSASLNAPCFDIYYHHRGEGMKLKEPAPIQYALVVSIKANKVVDLYDRVLRTYSNILIPLRPQNRIQIRS